jgi:hypothetical protein
MNTLRTTTASLLATLLLATNACNAPTDDEAVVDQEEVSEIRQQLEMDNGGFEMTDEVPAFGEPGLMDEATLPEIPQQDEIAELDEISSMQLKPDAVLFHTQVMWGQFPLNWDAEQPRNWTGVIAVNRGAIVVKSTVAFEGPTDNLIPRNDPKVVPFTSATLPHHDGLRLLVIDPDPTNAEPQVLVYATSDGAQYAVPMALLAQGPQTQLLDDQGNRIVAAAVPQPVDLCSFGMLGGHWHKVGEDTGKLIGPVVAPNGDVLGHMRGIYGVKANGEKVFFGKYINSQGLFMGLFAGHYGDGDFAGKWLHKAGEVGVLGGHYVEDIPGPETGGHFLGGWREASCNFPIQPQAQPQDPQQPGDPQQP